MGREIFFFATSLMLIIGFLTFMFPIEIYDGYVVYEDGRTSDEKLSMSYFLDKPSFLAEYAEFGVADIHLKAVGWLMFGIVNFGIPLLVGYRIALALDKKRKTP
jgi:hypothetical protein